MALFILYENEYHIIRHIRHIQYYPNDIVGNLAHEFVCGKQYRHTAGHVSILTRSDIPEDVEICHECQATIALGL